MAMAFTRCGIPPLAVYRQQSGGYALRRAEPGLGLGAGNVP